MLSSVDINSFQFQLSHQPSSYLETVTNLTEKQLTPLKYEELVHDNIYTPVNPIPALDESFLEDSEKYIKDISLYAFPSSLSNINNTDIPISYGYGMEAKLYFDGLNDFLYNHDETIFLSHQQTHLVMYFDEYSIPENGLFLKVSGNIGDILIEDFVKPIKINSDNGNRITVGIGPLIDELLLNSHEIFDNGIENSILEHLILSIDSYTHNLYNNYYLNDVYVPVYDNFSILKISNENLPHIDVFYSE